MGHLPKNNKNRVQTFAGGSIWVDVREKQLIGRLTVLSNDKQYLLTDLSFIVRKKFMPKNYFPRFCFFDRKILFCKKTTTNIQIVTHPYLARLCWKFFTTILLFGHRAISVFFRMGPKNWLIPSGAIWANVHEKQLMGRLTVLPNDEEMLLTNLSSKFRKKNLGAKNNFLKFGFWTIKICWGKKVTNIQVVTHPFFRADCQKHIGSFSLQFCCFGIVQ